MEYKIINLDTWERGKLFRFFIDNLRNVMSMTVDIDVTPLKEFIKAQGLKFYPTMMWVVKVKDEYCLKYEEENKLLVPLFNAPTTDVILNYINETILEIYIYDRDNNTSLLETLYQYLLNNKSLNETSRILFVHKNTVTYRLERVKDLFNIDFNNVENNLSFMYSASIIKYLDSIKCKALSELKIFS